MHNEQSAPSPEKKPRRRSWFGPGLLISASFIGPGTVTTATVAGADFGFALAWAVVFSILEHEWPAVRAGLEYRLDRRG